MTGTLPTTARDGDLRAAEQAFERHPKLAEAIERYANANSLMNWGLMLQELNAALTPSPAQDPVPALGLPAGEVEGLRALFLKSRDEAVEEGKNAVDYAHSRWWSGAADTWHRAAEAVRTHFLAPPASAADGEGQAVIIEATDAAPDKWALTIQWPDGTETVETVSDNAARVLGYRSEDTGSDEETTPPPVPPSRVAGLDREADWRDDPAADAAWSAGLDYGMEQLCAWLGVDRNDVSWDAATETLDGDVQAVLGNILRQKFGDNFDFKAVVPLNADAAPTPGETPGQDAVEALRQIANLSPEPDDKDWRNEWMEPVSYRFFDVIGQVHETGVDTSNQGDIECWAHEKGLHTAAVIARSALASLRSTQADTGGVTIPDGWKLVPVEPTEAMSWAGWRAKDAIWSGDSAQPMRDPANCYRAMLDAAPTPLATDGEG